LHKQCQPMCFRRHRRERESDEMNFELGYLETDAPGAIFPVIRAADSVLEYSRVLERRAQKTNWQFFVERREFSKFAN